MRRALAPVMVIALAAVAPSARGDEELRRIEQRRALLLQHRLPLAPAAGAGRRKPDDTGDYDLEAVDIALDGGGPGEMPASARFEVTVVAMRPLDGALVLLAPFFEPLAVRRPDGRGLEFRHAPETGELLVALDAPVRAGERVRVVVDAAFTPACPEPSGCITDDLLRHVAEPGWYPLSAQFPLSDRFRVSLRVGTAVDEVASGAGERLGEEVEGDRRFAAFRSEIPTVLTAFAIGEYRMERLGGGPGDATVVELFAPPDTPGGGRRLGEIALDVTGFYAELLGPFPFRRLGVTAISDLAGAGIGPQANVLIPDTLWRIPGDRPEFDLVRRVVAHEIGHQYFFNLVAVSETADAWLSEGFAEYVATRYSERVTGRPDHARLNYWGYVLGVPPIADVALWDEDVAASPHYFEIVYQKGSAVLDLLRRRLGGAAFDRALAAYVEAFADEIATTPELERFLAEYTGERLDTFFEQWVYRAGFPTLRVRAAPARRDGDPVVLSIEQVESRHGPFAGPLPIRAHYADGSTEMTTVRLEDGGDRTLGVGPAQWVEIDPELTLFRQVRPEPTADVNLSGVVDGMDLLDVYFARGREAPDPAWDDRVDVNGDLVVDRFDLAAVREQLGRGW